MEITYGNNITITIADNNSEIFILENETPIYYCQVDAGTAVITQTEYSYWNTENTITYRVISNSVEVDSDTITFTFSEVTPSEPATFRAAKKVFTGDISLMSPSDFSIGDLVLDSVSYQLYTVGSGLTFTEVIISDLSGTYTKTWVSDYSLSKPSVSVGVVGDFAMDNTGTSNFFVKTGTSTWKQLHADLIRQTLTYVDDSDYVFQDTPVWDLSVYRNGLLLTEDVDYTYTLDGTDSVLNFMGDLPETTDNIQLIYRKEAY